MRIMLPDEVAQLYQIVKRLEEQYPGRPFTLDGRLFPSDDHKAAMDAIAGELMG